MPCPPPPPALSPITSPSRRRRVQIVRAGSCRPKGRAHPHPKDAAPRAALAQIVSREAEAPADVCRVDVAPAPASSAHDSSDASEGRSRSDTGHARSRGNSWASWLPFHLQERRARADTHDVIARAAGVEQYWNQDHGRSRTVSFPSLVYDTYFYASDVPFSKQLKANTFCVMTFAFAGVACRYAAGKLSSRLGIAAPSPRGLQADGYLDAIIFYDLLANILGSFVMGICAGASPWIIPRFPAVYAGITTGFCGCFTTFSSWNNAAASIMLRGQLPRGLLCLVVGFTTASVALRLGAQLASKALSELFLQSNSDGSSSLRKPGPRPLYNTYKLPVSRACCCVLLVCFAALAAVELHNESSEATLYLGLCFAPFFAALRYHLSSLNKSHPTMPCYTLLANAIASGLTSTVTGLTWTDRLGLDPKTQIVLKALSLGAAGSLSTVSSFVNECRLLPPRYSCRYIVVTFLVCQSIGVSLLAGFRVFHGWDREQ